MIFQLYSHLSKIEQKTCKSINKDKSSQQRLEVDENVKVSLNPYDISPISPSYCQKILNNSV